MAENIEKRLKIELPDGRKGNVSESKLEGLKNKYPELKIVGYMDGSAYEPSTPTQEQTRQKAINISDASMPMDSVQMMGNTAIGTELPPVDANNEEIQAQEFAEQQLRQNVESAYDRIAEKARPVFENAAQEQVKRNTFDTENKERKSFFRRFAEFTGNIAPRGGNRVSFINDPYMTDKNVRTYADAMDKLKEAKNLIKDTDKNSSFFKDAGRGIARKTFDIDTWTAGVSDMLKDQNLQSVLNKYESGEQLSEEEDALLEAATINSAVADLFGQKMSRGYKAGMVTAESIPFMIEMMANPASGFSKGIGTRLARYGVQKGMGKAATLAMSYAGKAGADIIGANLMSLSTGSGRVVAGALDRQLGHLNYALDNDGAIKFTGMEGGEDSFIKALSKSYKANTISNFSEMLGAYFAPISRLAGDNTIKFLKHFPKLSKAEDAIKIIRNSDISKFVTALDKETKLSGVFGEFSEEIADGLLNSLFVGDQKASEVFEKDNLIDTFLGVSLLGGTRIALKTAGIARYGNDLVKMYKAQAEQGARRSGINEKTWEYEKGQIDKFSSDEYKDGGYKELKEYLKQRFVSDAFNRDQITAIFDYAAAVQKAKGIELATQKARQEGIDTYEAAEPSDIPDDTPVSTEQQPSDQEFVLSKMGLTSDNDITHKTLVDGKIESDGIVRPVTVNVNGNPVSGYLIRETEGGNGMTAAVEVKLLDENGQAYTKVVTRSDIIEEMDGVDAGTLYSQMANQFREAEETERRNFEAKNQDAIESAMTPEQRQAHRQAVFNDIQRNTPEYDDAIYASTFDVRGQRVKNLTEEQKFVIGVKEEGVESAVNDIFYQRGLQERKIAESVAKEQKMMQEGKDLDDIRKERDRRKNEQGRLDAINKIIEERGLIVPESNVQAPAAPVADTPPIQEPDGSNMVSSEAPEMMSVTEDVSREKAEQEPIEQKDRFQAIYDELPKDKDGKIKTKGLSSEQIYSKVRIEMGEEEANGMLQEEIDDTKSQIEKLRGELQTKRGLQKAELYDKIGELEGKLKVLSELNPSIESTAPATAESVAESTVEETAKETTEETVEEQVQETAEEQAEEQVEEQAEEDAAPIKKSAQTSNKTKKVALPKNIKELLKLSGDELKEVLSNMLKEGTLQFGTKKSWVKLFGEELEKVKDVDKILKAIDPKYVSKGKRYLAVRDLRDIVKGVNNSTDAAAPTEAAPTEEAPIEEAPIEEASVKEEKKSDVKPKKKHISLAELRAMSGEELKNKLIELANEGQIKIYRKDKGVKIGKTIYSKGVLDELLKKVDPTFEPTRSMHNTKAKLREVANIEVGKKTEAQVSEKEAIEEEPVVGQNDDLYSVNVVYKDKEVTLGSLVDIYRRLYDAVQTNKKKVDTAIGKIAKKYIPNEMKSISDFLTENGIDISVLDESVNDKKTDTKEKDVKEPKKKQVETKEPNTVIEDGYEIVEVTKDGEKEKRVMLNADDYLRRRVYWAREELKKAKKEGKDNETIKNLENNITVLNKTAQERGIKSTTDARKGDAALAKEYESSPYGKREIEYYNKNGQTFEYDVVEQPKSKTDWMPQNIKKMAVELVKEIPNLNSDTTTQKGSYAMKKVDDNNNLFVRVNNNGIAEYYYGTEKQPKSELFKPIEYEQRVLTKEEKDFTKESIDSYTDYLSAGEQMRAMKFDGLKIDEKKEVLAQRNIIQQKRDQWKKGHKEEIKEWQAKSSMRFEKAKPKADSAVDIEELSEQDKAAIEEALSGEINLDDTQGVLFNPDDFRFQVSSTGSTGTRRATISEVKTLVDAISAVFPSGYNKVKILSGKKFSEAMSELKGRRFANDNGTTCGFVAPDGTVYINQDEARIDTPLHEIGIHRLVDLAKDTDNKDMLKAIFNYARTAPREIIEEVHKLYPNLDTRSDAFWEEVAAKAFGLQNEGRLEAMLQTEADKAWWKKLVEAVKKLWNKIAKTEPTYKDMSLYQGLSNLGHEDIGLRLFDMLTSEGAINLGEINVNGLRYKAGVPKRVKEYKTVQIFGGIWIDSEEEYAKFVSAVNMSPFEENGEGIAYTDNHFYAYYRNIEGEPIPYYDIYLNAEQSQEVIKQVKEELRNGSKNERNQLYIDRATKLVGDINSKNNDYNGDNNSVSNSRRNDTLGSNILRKGRYADNPSLYVKTSRTDGVEVQDVNYSFLQDNDSIDEIASYSALEALRESGLDIDSYDTSDSLPNTDELVNGVLTRKGEERMQRVSYSANLIHNALNEPDCPENAHPSAWMDYLKRKGAMDTKRRGGLGQKMYEWLSKQNSMSVIKREDLIKRNQDQRFEEHPIRKWADKLFGKSAVSYMIDSDQSVREIQEEVLRLTGADNLDTREDFVKAHNLESSKIARGIETFKNTFQKRLDDAYKAFAKYADEFALDPTIDRPFREAVDRYLFALHAKERNRKINIDNLVDKAMEYAKSIDSKDMKKSDFEAMARKYITDIYDEAFMGKTGVSKTAMYDSVKDELKNKMANIEKKLLQDLEDLKIDNNQTGENLSDTEAEAYITAFEAITTEEERKELTETVKESTSFILDSALESGLISADTYNTYKNQYQHYVPLRNWSNEESREAKERLDKSYFIGISSVTGEAEVEKKAKGRQTDAASPLATIFLEAQDTIVRGEKNKTLNTLARLNDKYRLETEDMIYISETEDIDKDELAPTWVKEMAKMNMEEGMEHTIGIKVNGQNRRLYIAGETGRRFVKAYKNLDSKHISDNISAFTKFSSRVLTTYNPTFWVSNTERDIRGGARNMYIYRDAEYSKDMIKNLGASLVDCFNGSMMGKESDMYKLYLDNGGSISFYKQKETRDIVKDAHKRAEEYVNKGMSEENAFKKALLEAIPNLASVTEEMTRYAAFKTAVEHGESPAEAAYLAHEITTNLARRGSQRIFSNLYSFFNPTIQGVYQMFTSFSNPKTRKKAIAAYGADIALNLTSKIAMLALSMAMFNDDKDDDEKIGIFDKDNPYWSIDENTRNNTTAIPIGIDENGIPKCILIQRPHQFRMFSSIVDYALEAASGRITGKEFTNKYLKRVIAETAPFNSANYNDSVFLGLFQQFAPSFLRPIVDVGVNANSFGSSIRRDEYSKSQPEYLVSKGSGIKLYTSISKALNDIWGSAGVRGAWLQVNADDIKYIVDNYTGFAGKLTHGVINSVTRLDAEKERYGNSFANIFGNIYWENKDGAMYQSSQKLREYADSYILNLLNNPNANLIKEFIKDPETMKRITDKATIIATEMYNEYSGAIKELENSWNNVLGNDDISTDEQNAILEAILEGIVDVNTNLGKGFEDVLNDIIKEEKR